MRKLISVAQCHEGVIHHPTHKAQIGRLNRVSGQLAGIKKMITEQRYCPEILIQVRAASSALRSLESAILETHLESCIRDTMAGGSEPDRKRKIKELMKIFRSGND